MIAKGPTHSIRRILVALDASPSSRLAVQTATELAAAFGGEVLGLFVEESDLLRVAELPFAREVSAFLATCRRLDARELERALQAQAQQMYLALETAARQMQVPWEFRVVRGTAAEELLSAAAGADLVIMGKAGRSLMRHRQIGSTTRIVLSRGRGMTMIVHNVSKPATPVTVLYNGSETSKRALGAAILLAMIPKGRVLRVAIVADSEESALQLRSEVIQLAAEPEHNLSLETAILIKPSFSQLIWFLQTDGGGPVVVPGNALNEQNLCTLVNEIAGPVLLVGESDGNEVDENVGEN